MKEDLSKSEKTDLGPPATAVASDGLTASEAEERLRQFGPNAVGMARPRRTLALLRKFWGVIPWMLELAIILDLILGRWLEAGVIAAMLVFNALLGFFQETQAQRAVALLRQELIIDVRVRRDGRWKEVPAAQLVPDDLVHLRTGDVVPADIRLTDGLILVDQSQLTGESLPAEQHPGSTAYAGSMVSRGEATGIVSATGSRTYFGKTTELVRMAEAPRRTELLIVRIARYLVVVVIILAVVVLGTTLARGMSLFGLLPFFLMLLVASVPVVLPAMFTMSAALGTRALTESGILVTRLSAIQDAASMDVLCLDKTGTITENRLTVEAVVARAPETENDVLRLAALASDEATQDPIDLAILRAAGERGLLADLPVRVDFLPFDPTSKRSEASIRHTDGIVHVIKGAPSVVAELAGIPWPDLAADVARLSADGARVLAVLSGSEPNLRLAGLLALTDPPRSDSAALIAALRNRGVRVLLVTGDGEATARAIATKVGIAGNVAPVGTLHENLDPQAVAGFEIFPGVFPQEKFFLIQALQKAGHVVGMTGDGVNDAAALRQADVGIAVARATDVAKAAASLVLTKPGLREIARAIEESRKIYQRLLTFVLTMIGMKIGTSAFIALGVLLFSSFVLNPVLIVLLMFTTNVVQMSVSTDRVSPSPTPDRWIMRTLLRTGLLLAALLVLASAGVFWVATNVLHLGGAQTQTLIFVWLVFAIQATLYVNRVRGFFWTARPGRWVVLATLVDVGIVALLATQGWLMAPISLSLIGSTLLLGIGFLIVADLFKVALTRNRLPQ